MIRRRSNLSRSRDNYYFVPSWRNTINFLIRKSLFHPHFSEIACKSARGKNRDEEKRERFSLSLSRNDDDSFCRNFAFRRNVAGKTVPLFAVYIVAVGVVVVDTLTRPHRIPRWIGRHKKLAKTQRAIVARWPRRRKKRSVFARRAISCRSRESYRARAYRCVYERVLAIVPERF